jgi:hypothetical protein
MHGSRESASWSAGPAQTSSCRTTRSAPVGSAQSCRRRWTLRSLSNLAATEPRSSCDRAMSRCSLTATGTVTSPRPTRPPRTRASVPVWRSSCRNSSCKPSSPGRPFSSSRKAPVEGAPWTAISVRFTAPPAATGTGPAP